MTTAEKYRIFQRSPVINTARYIFNSIKTLANNTLLGSEIIEIKTGKTPSKQESRFYEDQYFNWFKPDEIGSEKYLFEAKDKVSKFAIENNQVTIYQPNTILINSIGDVGRVSILKSQASSNQQITGVRFSENVIVEYAYYYLVANREFFYVDLFQTTLPIVNQKKISSIPFVLPGVEEQQKIMDGLALIEKIKTIHDLDLIELTQWKTDFKQACRQFFIIQFNSELLSTELTHQLTLVQKLRQQFLQEAVQGKLAPQDPGDEPASILLQKIKAEKERLVKEKKIKKDKDLPEIRPEEIPFEIPEGWVWCRLGEISYIASGSTPSQDAFVSRGIPYLKMYNLKNQKIDFEFKPQYIKEEVHNGQLKRSRTQVGDVIMNIVGPPLGKLAIIPESLPESNFNQAGVLIRPYLFKDMNKWIFWYLNEMSEIRSISTKGVAGQDNISISQSNSMRIPLPPLAEQHRIVQKLEQLLQVCDALQASIQESRGYNEQLLQQVMREALKGE